LVVSNQTKIDLSSYPGNDFIQNLTERGYGLKS
jgi:hypothetical protein